MYVVGKTGMGKTTMLENMVLHDIYKGHGVGVVDPHGDFAEKIINYIPANRINDVVYINPGDVAFPIGFNILEIETEEQKRLLQALGCNVCQGFLFCEPLALEKIEPMLRQQKAVGGSTR